MIHLKDIFHIKDPSRFKLHLIHPPDAVLSPLEIFASDPLMEESMEPWRAEYSVWERKLIFALNQYSNDPTLWLFGGVFRVVECLPWRYALEDCAEYRKFVGRVVLRFRRHSWMQGFSYRFEDYLDWFQVVEILRGVHCQSPLACFN